MNTVVLEVGTLTDTLADAARAMDTGRAETEAHIRFATPELLGQVLTASALVIVWARTRPRSNGRNDDHSHRITLGLDQGAL
jgi:hypothetical protein